MVIRLQDILFDSTGSIEQPVLFLNTLTGEPICPISNRMNLTGKYKYNDVSEISFEVADKILIDNEWQENACFDELRGMRTIFMEPYGVFILVNPSISDDGIQRIKSCTAYSLEYELNYKTMPAIEGTFLFHDPTGTNDNTITAMILEQAPNWSIGHVDTTVATRYRTFDDSADSLYSFMMNTLQDSYGCVFLFDTRRRKINIYDMDNAVVNVPMYLSKTNLLMNQNIEELSDEIVTCLSVYGADDTSIASVNPLGGDKIYNLDYFIEIGDIPETIATKWKKWKENFDTYQTIFSNLFAQYYSNLMIYNAQNSILVDLEGQLSALNHVLDTYQTDASGDHSAEIADTNVKIAAKQKEVDDQKSIVNDAKSKCDSAVASMKDVVDICSFTKFFNKDELNVINAYIKEDNLQDSTYVVQYIDGDVAAANKVASDNPYSVSITEANLYKAENYKNLTDAEIQKLKTDGQMTDAELSALIAATNNIAQTHLGWNFFNISYGKLALSNVDKKFDLSGLVINSTLSYKEAANADGSHDCVVTLNVDSPTFNGEEPSTAVFVASGTCTNVSYVDNTEDKEQVDSISLTITGGIVSLTCDTSVYQRQNTIQDLYDYGKSCLHDLAYPAYEFDIDSGNFMWNDEFLPFKNNIALGQSVNIEFKDGFYLSPILIEMDVNYDDATDFKLIFGNKIHSINPEFKLADTIGKSAKTSSSLNSSKFTYKAFANSTVQNDVEKLIHDALDVAKNAIINSNGQNVIIDDGGIHLIKIIDKVTGEKDPCEIRLVNNQIVFTDDGWDSAKLAIGKIKTDPNSDAYTMGVVAESLIGNIIIGNKLVIESTGTDPITGDTLVKLFRVDEKGAFMRNSIIAMEGSKGNKMLFDPNFGCSYGDSTTFYDENGVLKYGFMDYTDEKNPVLKLDKDGFPTGSSFFYDIDNNKAYFRGDIYANNGYFKGDVTCTSLDCTNATVTGLSVGDNITMGPDARITWAQVEDAEENVVTITKDTIDAPYIKTLNLEVGNEITMGPNAVITWNNLPSDVASGSYVDGQVSAVEGKIPNDQTITTITQNAITTGSLHIGGSLYHIVEGSNWWETTEHMLLGINSFNNLQLGTPSSVADYNKLSLYAPDNIYMLPGGASLNNPSEDGETWTMVVRGTNSPNGRGVSVHGNMYVNTKRVLTTEDLNESGDTPAINNGHYHSGKVLKCIGIDPKQSDGTSAYSSPFSMKASMEVSGRVFPSINATSDSNGYNLGKDNAQWNRLYVRELVLNGESLKSLSGLSAVAVFG